MTVPIVRLIGLGLGMLLWGTSCLVAGWASGKFGLFGLHPQPMTHPILNYCGVMVAIVSGVAFMLIRPSSDEKPESEKDTEAQTNEEERPLMPNKAHVLDTVNEDKEKTFFVETDEAAESDDEKSQKTLKQRFLHYVHMDNHQDLRHFMMHYFHLDALSLPYAEEMTRHCLPITLFHLDTMPTLEKRILGVLMAIIAGSLYGVSFNPTQWLIDNDPEAPRQAVLYFYSHICGILLSSTFYFIIYCVLSRNKPQVFPQVTLPALISGFMWSLAQLAYFKATSGLGMVITTPIATVGPGVVGALWSVFVFHEIRGRSNYLTLVVAIAMSTIAILMIAFSF